MTGKDRYHIVKLYLRSITECNYDVCYTKDQEVEAIISCEDSLFLDQLKRLCGNKFIRNKKSRNVIVPQVILVEAKKSPNRIDQIKKLISEGFNYNGVHFVRYGKSSSQGKDGITLFVDEAIYNTMFEISQLGIGVDECVISKYESQRCLTLSTCTIIEGKLPNIVIIDEFTKLLQLQKIRYVVQDAVEIVDKESGEKKNINQRKVEDGFASVKLSPWDGCGCHDKSMSQIWSNCIGLKGYTAVGFQIRLPFFKGYSVEFPFKEYYKSIGITEITDVFGKIHNVQDIDCIWNISMWKGYSIFNNKFGNEGWTEYVKTLDNYHYKLGISKYSHHKKDMNLKTRMNFQYLQCLDLWNEKYVDWFNDRPLKSHNILNSNNWGDILKLASYSTNLFEKIVKGDKRYTYKFLGVEDSETSEAHGKYLEAALINDSMLKDPAIKQFIYRKLKKSIEMMKFGKIYADGFYHTCVGDMIGYLEYACGLKPVGCLDYKEFFCDTIPFGKILSFRSPLVCPSEVNDVSVVSNELTKKWCGHFKDQDVVMVNLYDMSLPQQGGADLDGDALFLCFDEYIVNNKVHKNIIIDIEDKATSIVKPYNQNSILEYELNSRDNRIGEITNVATSIINQYTIDPKWKKVNDDNISLLRVFQGEFLAPLYSNVY